MCWCDPSPENTIEWAGLLIVAAGILAVVIVVVVVVDVLDAVVDTAAGASNCVIG